MAPIGTRPRDWIRAHPRRARMALAAAVLTVAAAGGAFVGLRPGGGDEGRLRHRQFAGSVEDPGETRVTAGSGSTEPGAAPGSTRTSATGASGTTAPGRGAPSSGPPPTGVTGSSTGPAADAGGVGSTPSSAGQPSTSATGPSGAGRGSAPTSPATTASAGWDLLPKAPIDGRAGHTAVWTGREMVIWGGATDFDSDPVTDGAAFDAAARTWRKLPAAPIEPRFDARAFWTGKEMIIYGGGSVEGVVLGDGAAWDPATNRWRTLPASPIGARDGAVVAWSGDRLVVWGGSTVLPADAPDGAETEMKNDGAAYVPATNSWVPLAAAPIPARSAADSVWTGTRLIISGGYHEGDDDDRTDGAALDPVSGAWSPIAVRPSPGSCGGGSACAGIWTGRVALFPVSGLSYDPTADRWSAMAAAPVPDGPAPGEPSVWSGRRFLTWGISGADADDPSGDAGGGEPGPPPIHGAAYDPVANRWQPFGAGPLSSRVQHTAVWTGQEMLIWGGTGGETPLADGAAYRPE